MIRVRRAISASRSSEGVGVGFMVSAPLTRSRPNRPANSRKNCLAGLGLSWSGRGMSETPNPIQPPPVRRRRKPGLAARAPHVEPPARAANPIEGHYEECPQQQPTSTSEHVFTALPSRHGLLPAARAWLGRLASGRIVATLTASLLALCATVALAAIVRGTAHHEHHLLAPPATQITATPSASTRVAHRHRGTALHRRRPGSGPERVAHTCACKGSAGSIVRPPQAVPGGAVPVVHAAPSEPAGSPPTGGSVEGQTEGGPFSP